jgi:peptide/nickel transport system permease protein
MAEADIIAVEAERTFGAPATAGRRAVTGAFRPWLARPLGLFGAVLIVFLLLVAIAAPWIAPYSGETFSGGRLESPNSAHPLGTNNLGQDVLSRTIYGAQISIAVAVTATTLGVGLGTILGVISAYSGGAVDLIVQRAMEVLASFPGIILALIVISALGRPYESGHNVFLIAWQLRSLEVAIALGFVFGVMRIVRSSVLKERELAYIEAATTIGASHLRIMFRHILPNCFPVVIVAYTSIIGGVVLIEAGLSFLGYGVSIGTPSWGMDLSNRNREYFLNAPWLLLAPGAALSLTVLGFNFLGDALRDILDPRLRGTG